MKEIKIPHECYTGFNNRCHFLFIHDYGGCSCVLYNKCVDRIGEDTPKPKYCKAELVTVQETPLGRKRGSKSYRKITVGGVEHKWIVGKDNVNIRFENGKSKTVKISQLLETHPMNEITPKKIAEIIEKEFPTT